MTTAADTLSCDTSLISAWQHDAAYDYQRELSVWQPSLWDWLLMEINDMLTELFGSETAQAITRPLLITLGISVALLVLWLIVRRHPSLFMRRRKEALAAEADEDNIYGVDFDAVIWQAVASGDYRQAVRYTYLQTLRHLSDRSLIDWQLHKTPQQYVGEYRDDHFRQLTNIFMRIRYGNYEATEPIYDTARELSSSVVGREGGSL